MMKALRYLFLLAAVVIAALAYRVLPALNFNSDMMALFPQSDRVPAVTQANEMLEEGVTRKLFFLLSSSDWSATLQALTEFEKTLLECDCIADVTARQKADDLAGLRAHYRDYASVLLSAKNRVLLQEERGDVLIAAALQELTTNPARLSTATLLTDPLATFDDFLTSLQNRASFRGSIEQGYIYFDDENSDRRYLLVTAELRGSPYSVTNQAAAHQVIAEAEEQFTAAVSEGEIVHAGAFFYARAGTEQAQREISTVGAGSLLGILLIFLLVFRSPALLLLAMVPTASGVIAGLVLCQMIFGNVHVIALVFGASLIGISIDYSLHFLCKRQALDAEWQPESGLRKLLVGLSLGLATTTAGYIGFALAGFPGFRQVAVFSCVGLVVAYLAVVGLYPWILHMPSRHRLPQLAQTKILNYLRIARRYLPWMIRPEFAVPIFVLIAGGLWQMDALDDIRKMQTPSVQLQEQEKHFRDVVGGLTAMQYLLVEGDTPDALLQKLEQLREPLEAAKTAGAIGGYTNLSTWIPSMKTQQTNVALVREQLIETGLLENYLLTLGVNDSARTQILSNYEIAGDGYLTIDNTIGDLQALLKRPLYFTARSDTGDSNANNSHDNSSDNGLKHYSLLLLENLQDPAPLQAMADENENVLWVDKVVATNQLLQQYREHASIILIVAYGFVLLLMSLRYRIKGAVLVVLPPLLASLSVLALFGWLGIGISIFNIVALLLVLGIGIDSTLFLRESKGKGYDTLFAAGLSALTTILSFGLLALSATHVIFSFGLTVLVGILLSFVFAPMASLTDSD